jgi:hypothetical protein
MVFLKLIETIFMPVFEKLMHKKTAPGIGAVKSLNGLELFVVRIVFRTKYFLHHIGSACCWIDTNLGFFITN